MTPCPSLSPSRSVDGCVATCALSGNKLAFFFCFKTTPDYFECIPLGTKRIWFSLHCRWVFCPLWQKKQRVAHPILVISEVAACWLRVLLCVASRTNTACTPCPITVSLVIVLGHTFIMISVLVMVVKHCSISPPFFFNSLERDIQDIGILYTGIQYTGH